MKTSVWLALFMAIIVTGCIKTIASEEEVMNPEFFHNKPFGASAEELLSDKNFTSLKVEIQYMPGFEPDQEAVYELWKFLHTHLNKPEGISVVTRRIKAAKDTVLTKPEVLAIERANRSSYTSGKEIALYVLYTNGEFTNSKILGYAHRNTSVVIFGKNINENSGKIGKPDRTRLESTVLLHEMGHLLGLVNEGSTMQKNHKDTKHASHCRNRKCLMYYGIEIEDKFGHLIKKGIPKLDEDCLADLKARGGK